MNKLNTLNKTNILREVKDLVFITFGLCCYSMAWAAFLLPYQITTGGVTGIAAIIFYATGFPIQYSYFTINTVLILFSLKILGAKFTIKTLFGIFMLTFLLGLFQELVGDAKIIREGQEFMA